MDAIASHIWQSTICAAAAAMLVLFFRNNAASVRYWIWFAAAVKFLVPFAALTAVANALPLPQSPPAASGALEAATVIFRLSAIPTMPRITSTFIVIVWLLGAFAVLITWARRSQHMAIDARKSPPILYGMVHDTLRFVERAEGIRTPTAIVASCQSIEPGVIGTWAPMLIWPQHLTPGLSDAQIETVIAHEVCHIVRRDNLLASIQMLVTAVFWFYPLVWWIGARLVDERERACDERVLARGGRPAIYAESILETCRLCIASPLVNVAGVTGGNLKTRIARIMKNVPLAPLGVRQKIALVTAVLLTVFAPIASGMSTALTRQNSAVAAAQDPDTEVHRPGRNVVAPKLIREVKPQYTARAMQDKIEGEILMECVVKVDGTVGEQKIVKSLDPDLDQAALDAAAQWLFEPGTRDGKPVNVLVTITIAFTLK